jgi:uncharacterized protein YkwD
MQLEYNIQSTDPNAVMAYKPTRLKLWISENKVSVPDTVEEGAEQTYTDYIDIQSEATHAITNGTMVIAKNFKLPAAALQPMITGYELGGKAIINIPMLNNYLRAYHEIEII